MSVLVRFTRTHEQITHMTIVDKVELDTRTLSDGNGHLIARRITGSDHYWVLPNSTTWYDTVTIEDIPDGIR